jgi:hypothetical protein
MVVMAGDVVRDGGDVCVWCALRGRRKKSRLASSLSSVVGRGRSGRKAVGAQKQKHLFEAEEVARRSRFRRAPWRRRPRLS